MKKIYFCIILISIIWELKTSKVYKTIETEILDKETGEIVSNKSETEK